MPAAMITEAEDTEGRKWALKRVQADGQAVREAERLAKLCKHPLVVPLQSIFVDGGIIFLQMPFYRNGDLRAWVEKIKVCCMWWSLNPTAACEEILTYVAVDKCLHTSRM